MLDDNSGVAGVRGGLNGWDVDFSVTHGTNALHYFVEHSDNASMGTASPTTFDAGQLTFGQTVGNLDLVRPLGARGGVRSLSFLVDVGGRLESYSDFGRRFNWKVASRLEVAPRIAVRGAASTGFRAPSLAQVWFNNVSNQFAIDASGNLVLNRVLTSNNQSRVTKAFGIPDLAEETSVNLSAGITAQPRSNVSLTADFYRITIDNRIVLTSQFSSLP